MSDVDEDEDAMSDRAMAAHEDRLKDEQRERCRNCTRPVTIVIFKGTGFCSVDCEKRYAARLCPACQEPVDMTVTVLIGKGWTGHARCEGALRQMFPRP